MAADLTPRQWVDKLDRLLKSRQEKIDRLERYYEGDHPLANVPERAKFKETYRRLLRQSRSNWMKLIIDVPVERLTLTGFRWPVTEEEPDQSPFDTKLAALWEANDLDVGEEQIHQTACLHGVSYALVAPPLSGSKFPVVSPEHPGQMIVAVDPETRRRRLAAWKCWLDDDGYEYGTLYLPDRIYRVRSSRKRTGFALQLGEPWTWIQRDDEIGPEIPNPFGVVPVVPFVNQPGLRRPYGVSDIDDLTDTQDRINETIFGRMVAAQFGAFRQRWGTGLPLDRDDDGNMKKPFEPGASELWVAGKDGRFGEFSESDLKGYISSVEADIQHLAAQSRTPPHYLLGQSGAFPSGESLKSTETGLVAKVVQRQTYFTPAWREVATLALAAADEKVDTPPQIVWKDPEARTLGELVDSLVKMRTLGVPLVVLWQRYGASPQEIAEWQVLRTQEAIDLALADPGLPVEAATPAAA